MQTTTGFKVDANVNPFEQAMRRMVDSAKAGESGVGSALAGIAGPLGGLKTAFAALSAIASGAFLQSAITATVQMTENAMDLGRALGISTNEARAIQMALKDIGADAGEFEAAAKGMVKKIKENEEGMNAMGLATRDASGNLRPMNDLVVDGIKVLGTYKEGTDRALASTEIFGKGISSSSKLMLLNKEVTDENRAAMKELGLEVGENSVAAWKDFDAATDRAGFSMDGLKKGIGDALLPVLTTLVEVFNAVMPAAIVVVKGALSGLTSAFLFVRNGVVVLWETINAMVITVTEPIRAMAEAIGKAVTGDFQGAANALKGIGGNIAGAWDGAMDRMTESSRKTAAQVSALFSEDTKAGSGGGPGAGTNNFTGKPNKDKKEKAGKADAGDKEVSAMQTYDQVLEYAKLAYEKENTLRQFSKQQELQYWKDILATYEVGAKDKGAINLKIAKLEVETMRQGAKEQKEISQLRAEDWRAETMDYIAELQSRAAFDREQGTTTQAEYLDRTAAFNAMRLQAEMEFIAQKMEVAKLDPENNLVLLEQLELQKAEIRRQYRALDLQNQQEQQTASMATFKSLADSIEGSWASSIKGVMTGTQTITQGLKGMFKGVLDSLIGMLAQMAAKWLAQQLLMKVMGKAFGLGEIAKESAKAGAGGVASMAAAPFPLNLGAPAFGAAMAALAMSFAPLASAAGGFDIPAGLNPMTQLHAEEMVLPASIANPLRNSLAGDGAVGGGGATNVTIHAMDSTSFEQFLKANPAAFAAGMKNAARRGY